MTAAIIMTFLNLFVPIFSGILLLRIILSYIVQPTNQFYEGLVTVTEPLLAPIRKVLPNTGGVDFSPLVTILLLQGLVTVVGSLIPG